MCVKEEEQRWEIGLADRWVTEVAGRVRRSPSASSKGRVEVSASEAIIVWGTEGAEVEMTVVG